MYMFLEFIKKNKIVCYLLLVYCFLELSIISWGIPSFLHPFLYHMDEWHQLQSVRAVFTQGTPNIPGAAHGSQLQFFISGIYLIPFYLIHIINPFLLKNPFSDLAMQGRLFEILRINTLLFGVATIIALVVLAKKYLKINPLLTIFLFIFTPTWLQHSNYFKYDIALIFWIVVSLVFAFRYQQKSTLKNYIALGIVCGLAVATKISAVPLLAGYAFAYFLLRNKKPFQFTHLLFGMGACIGAILLLGTPDILLGRGDYSEFIHSNLVTDPNKSGNYVLHMSSWVYLFLFQYPANYGHGLLLLFVVSVFYWVWQRRKIEKTTIFLFAGLFIFFVSLLPLQLYFNGNRALVLLPYIALICGITVSHVWRSKVIKKSLICFVVALVCLVQLFESFAWMSVKWHADPRTSASLWIEKQIKKGETIGVENIPIYQMLPDILLTDFYKKEYKIPQMMYNPIIVDAKTLILPKIVVLSNSSLTPYGNLSEKKLLLERLQKDGYTSQVTFTPDFTYYKMIGDPFTFSLSIIIPMPVNITIYEKR